MKNPFPQVDPHHVPFHPLLEKMRKDLSPSPESTRVETTYYTTADGLRLFTRHFPSLKKPSKGVVVCFHGMGGDGEYYVLLADQLVSAGYDVWVYDHIGHGLSEGPRGDIKDFFQHCRIAAEFLRWIAPQYPAIPLFALGESMGGTILINTLLTQSQIPPLNGILLFAPGVKFKANGLSFKDVIKQLGALLVAPFAPGRLSFSTRASPGSNIKNGQPIMNPVHFEYDQIHPWHLDYVSPRFLLQLNKGFKKALQEGPLGIKSPLILFYGLNDIGIDRAGVESFFNRVQIPDKRLVEIDGAPHAMFTHPVFQPYWDVMRKWLFDHG